MEGIISPPKKRQKRTPFKREEKECVLNVYKTICEKNPKLSAGELHKLASEATGIHLSSIYRIINEHKTIGLQEPKPIKKRKLLINTFDEFTKNAIRRKVNSFIFKNELPTLNKILKAVEEDEDLPNIKRNTLYELLKLLNFKKRSQPDKTGELATRRNPKLFKSQASTSQSERTTDNATQENSSHIEQVYIKDEPIEADPNASSLYQQLRDSIKTELDNSETDSTNSDTEKHIDSISTDKEHLVNVKKEYSDSCENEISVNPEIVKTEQTTTFESVFVKQEPFEEDLL